MLHCSDTWPVTKEYKLALQWGNENDQSVVKITDMCNELRQSLGTDNILVITVVQQNRLRSYGHENEWMKYGVEGVIPR